MKKSMQELYKIIQMNHLWTLGSKSKHFSERNIKKKKKDILLSIKSAISEDLQTTKTHWHPKNSASDIKSVILMLQMFHWKYVPRKSVSSPGHHLTDASSFFHRLSQSSLVLNMALWAVLAWLRRQPIVTQRAETSRLSTKAPIAPNLALPHAVRLNMLKTRLSHSSYDQRYLTNL